MWWGVALATPAGRLPSLSTLLILGLAAVVMRAAGCAINDVADRDIDGRVARTRTRPIAAGEISAPAGIAFFVAATILGCALFAVVSPRALLWTFAVLPLIVLYPFAKRFTSWPQMVLGLTFNWVILIGWVAVRGEITAAPLLLYLGGALLTFGYDTLYAHQDRADDLLVGVRSSAIALGGATRVVVAAAYAAALALVVMAGFAAGLGAWVLLAVIPTACALGLQIVSVELDSPESCAAAFRANQRAGAFLLIGLVAATWLAGAGG